MLTLVAVAVIFWTISELAGVRWLGHPSR